jgi:hypothetical protein
MVTSLGSAYYDALGIGGEINNYISIGVGGDNYENTGTYIMIYWSPAH